MRYSILFILVLIFGCQAEVKEDEHAYLKMYNPDDPHDGLEYKTGDVSVRRIGPDLYPYYDPEAKYNPEVHKDQDGMILYDFRGKLVYHPVYLSSYLINLMEYIKHSGDSAKIPKVEEQAAFLLEKAHFIDSTYMFPYNFRYDFLDKDKLWPPWYSAMAQGKALSVFTRLYWLTGKEEYKEICHQIIPTFWRLKGNSYPWISCIDKNGYIWLEEYPFEEPTHVFNGMVFAMYGLYDYYMMTKSVATQRLLNGCFLTLKDHIALIRTEGDLSQYCFKYDHTNVKYHRIHMSILKKLSELSGEMYFYEFSKLLAEDYEAYVERQERTMNVD